MDGSVDSENLCELSGNVHQRDAEHEQHLPEHGDAVLAIPIIGSTYICSTFKRLHVLGGQCAEVPAALMAGSENWQGGCLKILLIRWGTCGRPCMKKGVPQPVVVQPY